MAPELEAVFDRATATHGGERIVAVDGDVRAANFRSPSGALAAAVDIARSAGEASRDLMVSAYTADASLGMGTQQAAIERAQRFHELANPGQVIASGVTIQLADLSLPEGVIAVDVGWHRLRDLGRREQVFVVGSPNDPLTHRPLRGFEAVPNNLPAQSTSFVGRARELAELRDLLDRARLVTLVGPGGAGKSRLAAQVAADLAERFPGGLWWVSLTDAAGPEDVWPAVARALGIEDTRGATVDARVKDLLGPRTAILVLDDCEHVVARAADVAERLLSDCPDLTVLATSREPLSVGAEMTWLVPPMSLPDEDAPDAEDLQPSDAVRLFIDRACAARSNFTVTNELAPLVVDICTRLDGIPLAIELAAARARSLTIEQILKGLRDRFSLLARGGARDAAPRQRTLRASVEWSHVQLGEAEQILFRRVGVFDGAFDLNAAEAVCSDDVALPPLEVLETLSRLVERSLVQFEEDGRYRLLQTIRAFALERLRDAEEEARLRERHLEHFLARAEAYADPIEATADPALSGELERERLDHRAALEHAIEAGDASRAGRLAAALAPFWIIRGHYWEAESLLRRALELDAQMEPSTHARLLYGLGMVSLMGMNVASGFGYAILEQALQRAREASDRRVMVRAISGLAFVDSLLLPDVAAARVEEATSLAGAEGDDAGLANLLGVRVAVSLFSGRFDDVLALLPPLRTLADRIGNQHALAVIDVVEGTRASITGDVGRGRELLERALASSRRVGEPALEMSAAMVLADLEIEMGNTEGAVAVVDASRGRLYRSARGRVEATELRRAAALVADARLTEANASCRQLQASLQDFPFPYFTAILQRLMSRIALASGEQDAATLHAEEALGAARAFNNPWLMSECLVQRALVARAAQDLDKAEEIAHEALGVAVGHDVRAVALRALDALAMLAADQQSYLEALRIVGAVDAIRAAAGLPRYRIDDDEFAASIAGARTATDDEGEDAYDSGERLSLEQVVAYVGRARGERRRPAAGWNSLTPTEREVVALVAKGLSNPAIAQQLFMSRATVKTHLIHVFSKLGVQSRAELAAEAVRRGF